MLACGERGAMVMGPPLMCDSAVLPCFHDCLAFPHRQSGPRGQSGPRDPAILGPISVPLPIHRQLQQTSIPSHYLTEFKGRSTHPYSDFFGEEIGEILTPERISSK